MSPGPPTWVPTPGNLQVPCNPADKDMTYWAPRLVREDPQYVYENRAQVEEFVNNLIN